MLPVQVSYWTLQETKRTNLERERLQGELQEENKRHNLESERLGWSTLAETSRHNKATEGIGYSQIALGYAQLGETTRHNVATEGIQREQAAASTLAAQTGWSRAQYQNAYDSARTATETGLLPYRKWESVAKTAQGLTSSVKNVFDSAQGFMSVASLFA